MANPNLVQAALKRFFTPQRRLHRPAPNDSAALQWADFADTQPDVFRGAAFAEDLLDMPLRSGA